MEAKRIRADLEDIATHRHAEEQLVIKNVDWVKTVLDARMFKFGGAVLIESRVVTTGVVARERPDQDRERPHAVCDP